MGLGILGQMYGHLQRQIEVQIASGSCTIMEYSGPDGTKTFYRMSIPIGSINIPVVAQKDGVYELPGEVRLVGYLDGSRFLSPMTERDTNYARQVLKEVDPFSQVVVD